MRRDPDDPFDDFFREIERMMEDMMDMSFENPSDGGDLGPATTHIDVQEYDDHLKVVADLPGVAKEDIDLKCDGRVLSISARSETREYDEQLRLPTAVDEHSGSATYNNGILEITFDHADDSADISLE
ncbi:MAG: Hsp20/alpha crystallin family protein [Halobacteriales archaeon]|nr:Hsp20/alpha crystallin family protein [Halobacteriales archaeon]